MPEPDRRSWTSADRPVRVATLAGWSAAAAGILLVVVAFVADPTEARAATAQVWSPFVLVGTVGNYWLVFNSGESCTRSLLLGVGSPFWSRSNLASCSAA